MPSRYQLHVQEWQDCQRCRLRSGRSKVVLLRGKIPCDIIFIGEAPGESENSLGKPFVGPAGKLLDHIISQSIPDSYRYALTNLVGCIPREEDGVTKAVEPDDECIYACSDRLLDVVDFCQPKRIVCVGKLSEVYLQVGFKHSLKINRDIPRINIVHPSAILRANVATKGFIVQRAIVTLRSMILDLESL